MTELMAEFGLTQHVLRKIRGGSYYSWFNGAVPPITARSREQRMQLHKEVAAQRIGQKHKATAEEIAERKASMPTAEVQAMRRKRAISEGGSGRLDELEAMLHDYKELSEDEWALLHRLRIGLRPDKYELIRKRPSKQMVRM